MLETRATRVQLHKLKKFQYKQGIQYYDCNNYSPGGPNKWTAPRPHLFELKRFLLGRPEPRL